MGFPGNSINELEHVEIPSDEEDTNGIERDGEEDEEEENENEESEDAGVLDPRAGRVDVVMSEIKFDPLEIVRILEDMKFKKFTGTRNRKCINRIICTYKNFASGTFPLGIQKLKVKRDELELPDAEDKAIEMMEFEEDLYGETRELKKLNKRKRKKILSNPELYEEFSKTMNAKKPKLIHNNSNVWNEEDVVDEYSYPSNGISKKTNKKLNTSNGFTESDLEPVVNDGQKKHSKSFKESTPPDIEKKSTQVPQKQSTKQPEQVTLPCKSSTKQVKKAAANETPKLNKKKKSSNGWETPLREGEVEYFVPSNKGKTNGLERTVTTADKETPTKKSLSPKVITTPINRVTVLKSSTPVDLLSSTEKKIKINLKNNISQEATEYMKQLKQSPSLPFDPKQKPIKGVLKPNLMPSPINPFYKKMIGFKHPNEK